MSRLLAWRREIERPLLDCSPAPVDGNVEQARDQLQEQQQQVNAIPAPAASRGSSAAATGEGGGGRPRNVVLTAPTPEQRQTLPRVAALLWPRTVERSILAYAAAVSTCGATGIFCIPAFPLFFTCAGVLPLVSVFLIMSLFGAAYVYSLLPDAANLYPAAALTTALACFYSLRFLAADRLRVRGPQSAGDLLLCLLSWVQLAVLARGVMSRRRATSR